MEFISGLLVLNILSTICDGPTELPIKHKSHALESLSSNRCRTSFNESIAKEFTQFEEDNPDLKGFARHLAFKRKIVGTKNTKIGLTIVISKE